MKLYTKGGDEGETSLYAPQRVPKHDIRIEAVGTTDELNAALGIAIIRIDNQEIQEQLELIQQELFYVGTDCATPEKYKKTIKNVVSTKEIERLEKSIDEWSTKLPPLKVFILPGGENGAAEVHLARTICRRAERVVSKLLAEHQIRPETYRYLNRLSDLLFIQARYLQDKIN